MSFVATCSLKCAVTGRSNPLGSKSILKVITSFARRGPQIRSVALTSGVQPGGMRRPARSRLRLLTQGVYSQSASHLHREIRSDKGDGKPSLADFVGCVTASTSLRMTGKEI